MRSFTTAGLVLVVVGVLSLIVGGDAIAARNVRLSGDLFAGGRQPILMTEWIAAAALGAGSVLTVWGLGRRTHRRRH